MRRLNCEKSSFNPARITGYSDLKNPVAFLNSLKAENYRKAGAMWPLSTQSLLILHFMNIFLIHITLHNPLLEEALLNNEKTTRKSRLVGFNKFLTSWGEEKLHACIAITVSDLIHCLVFYLKLNSTL
jgi:hypothetical protein